MNSTERALTDALAVITRDRYIRQFLEANDPKALEQARSALQTAGVDPDAAPPRSWQPEFQVYGNDDKWYGNALRFATRDEAEGNARAKFSAWTMARAYRATASDDEPNYRWTDNGLEAIK